MDAERDPEKDLEEQRKARWRGAFRPQPQAQTPAPPPVAVQPPQRPLQTAAQAMGPVQTSTARATALPQTQRPPPTPAPNAGTPQAAQTLQAGPQGTGRFANFAQYFNANAQSSADIANQRAAEAQAQGAAAAEELRRQRSRFIGQVTRDSLEGRATELDKFGSKELEDQLRAAGASASALGKGQFEGLDDFSSALVGGQGGSRFSSLQQQFGGLGDEYDKTKTEAEEFADTQKKSHAANAAYEQKKYEEKIAADAAAAEKAAIDRKTAEEQDKLKKSKGTYQDYMALNPFEAIRRTGRLTDPANALITVLRGGDKGSLDYVTDAMDRSFTEEGTSAGERVKFYLSMAELTAGGPEGVARVFNDMTPDELASLGDMSGIDILKYINKRAGK